MRWVGLVVGAVIAVGCRGAIESDEPPPLVQPDGGGIGVGSAADAGSGDLGGSPDGGPGGAQTTGPQVGDAGAGGDAGDASAPLCPPLPASTGGSDRPIPDWSAPTAVPFSCAPMPNAFFFPRPGTDVPGVYARCASFADARAI